MKMRRLRKRTAQSVKKVWRADNPYLAPKMHIIKQIEAQNKLRPPFRGFLTGEVVIAHAYHPPVIKSGLGLDANWDFMSKGAIDTYADTMRQLFNLD